MIIRVKNGSNSTYDYRRILFEDEFKLIRKAYGKSYFEKKLEEDVAEESKYKYEELGLYVELIPEEYLRNSNYRELFFKTYPQEKYQCVYCGRVFPKDKITVDHVFPVDKANTPQGQCYIRKNGLIGINDIKNLVPSCRHCNSKKRTKTGLWLLRAKLGQKDIYWIIIYILKGSFITLSVLLLGYLLLKYML
jgi:hypothetical protein